MAAGQGQPFDSTGGNPPPDVPLAVRLLWPEAAPEDVGALDDESARLAEARAVAFRLYARGHSLRQIADELKCGKSTVARHVQHVLDGYRLVALQDAAGHLARELARLAVIENALWVAWERSCGDLTQTVSGRRTTAAGAQELVSEKKLQRVGDAKLMALIVGCWDRRCRLIGLSKGEAGKPPPAPLVVGGEADPGAL